MVMDLGIVLKIRVLAAFDKHHIHLLPSGWREARRRRSLEPTARSLKGIWGGTSELRPVLSEVLRNGRAGSKRWSMAVRMRERM